MQFPKLTPLQSRFLACLGTSILLVIIYFSLSPTHFAYAAEVEATLNQDHNHHRIFNNLGLSGEIDWQDEEDFDIEIASYQSDFGPGVDRSIIGRAASGTFALVNNVPTTSNIAAGEIQYFVFDNESLWTSLSPVETGLPANLSAFSGNVSVSVFGKRSIPLDDLGEPDYDTEDLVAKTFKMKRQNDGDIRKVTITVNTVVQPSTNSSFTGPMPQCTLYISLSAPPAGESGPGPWNNDLEVPLVEGYAIASVRASNNVFVSVSAPPQSASKGLSGNWNYAIVASIDGPFYTVNSTGSGIFPIDTDSTTGLIATFNLTNDNSDDNTTATLREQFLSATPPFRLFVFNASDPRINGVQNSYAALAEIDTTPITVNASMTNRGMGANVKEQFYIQGLQAGTSYTAMLAYSSANFSHIWRPINFTTKSGKLHITANAHRATFLT
jgi:calcium channel MID1